MEASALTTLSLDVSNLTPGQAASQIAAWMKDTGGLEMDENRHPLL